MNYKTKLLGAGLGALLIIGLVTSANAAIGELEKRQGSGLFHKSPGFGMRQGWNRTAITTELGLPDDATQEQIGDAIWQKRIVELGLKDDSTLAQYHEAVKAEMQKLRQGRLEKLGLSADATPEQAMDAMHRWRQENKDLIGAGPEGGGFRPKGPGGGRCARQN